MSKWLNQTIRSCSLKRRAWLRAVLLGSSALLLVPISAYAGSYEDFFKAVIRDDRSTVSDLLVLGFDPNTVDAKGQVGLTLSLQLGAMRVFEVLLMSPQLDVNFSNPQGETPLMIAAIKGNLDAAKILIERKAAVNRPGWTPLHYAASGTTDQQVDMVALLLEHFAYIDAASPNASTPLMMAAQYGPADAARLLLREGADSTLKNKLGLTAVDFARRAGRDALAQEILSDIQRRQPRRGQW
jgi:uncharacterized protein